MAHSAERSYRIEANEFDSGLLANQVGVLRLAAAELSPEASRAIGADARAAGYDLITVATDVPIALPGVDCLGVVEEYAGSRQEARRRLGPASHFTIAPLTPDQWPAVEAMLALAAPTRFSRDPRLAPEVVRRHKIALLKSYYERYPEHSLIARSGTHGPLGFQASYLQDDVFVFYELFTSTGLVAAELLAENLDRLEQLRPDVERLRTQVYSDNARSRSFMTRIGLQPTGRKTHHYHLWP